MKNLILITSILFFLIPIAFAVECDTTWSSLPCEINSNLTLVYGLYDCSGVGEPCIHIASAGSVLDCAGSTINTPDMDTMIFSDVSSSGIQNCRLTSNNNLSFLVSFLDSNNSFAKNLVIDGAWTSIDFTNSFYFTGVNISMTPDVSEADGDCLNFYKSGFNSFDLIDCKNNPPVAFYFYNLKTTIFTNILSQVVNISIITATHCSDTMLAYYPLLFNSFTTGYGLDGCIEHFAGDNRYFNISEDGIQIYSGQQSPFDLTPSSSSYYEVISYSAFPMTIIDSNPAGINIGASANISRHFNITTNKEGIANWFVDGVLELIQSIGATLKGAFSWIFYDADIVTSPHNVSVSVTDGDTSSSREWSVNVTPDIAPTIPASISPISGKFDTTIHIICGESTDTNDDPISYQVSADFISSNGTQVYDYILDTQMSDGTYDWYVLNLPQQDNIKIKCQSFDSLLYSDAMESGNISIRHGLNLNMFESNLKKTYYPYENIVLAVYCSTDNMPNSRISETWADCNGDGQWDYAFDYTNYTLATGRNVKRSADYFTCMYISSGLKAVAVGCVTEKINQTLVWDSEFCDALQSQSEYCNIQKIYQLGVSEGLTT